MMLEVVEDASGAFFPCVSWNRLPQDSYRGLFVLFMQDSFYS